MQGDSHGGLGNGDLRLSWEITISHGAVCFIKMFTDNKYTEK